MHRHMYKHIRIKKCKKRVTFFPLMMMLNQRPCHISVGTGKRGNRRRVYKATAFCHVPSVNDCFLIRKESHCCGGSGAEQSNLQTFLLSFSVNNSKDTCLVSCCQILLQVMVAVLITTTIIFAVMICSEFSQQNKSSPGSFLYCMQHIECTIGCSRFFSLEWLY